MIEIITAVRNIRRNPFRSISIILTIALGVFLTSGVLIASDCLINSLENNFSVQLGKADIILKPYDQDRSDFIYNTSTVELLDSIPGVESYVPRIVDIHPIFTNTSAPEEGKINYVGINTTHPFERDFGNYRIIKTREEHATLTDIEDLLDLPGRTCVISDDFSKQNDLNLGDLVFAPATNMEKLGQNASIPEGWTNFTVVAIIKDQNEAIKHFSVPLSKVNGLEYPPRAIYMRAELLTQFVFTEGFQNISYLMIHTESFDAIDSVKEELLREFSNSEQFGNISWYGINLQAQFQEYLAQGYNIVRIFFTFLGVFSLIMGSIVIQNIMDISIDEIQHEIGIYRAIGARKNRIHKTLLIQLGFYSLLGTLLGASAGFLSAHPLLRIISESNIPQILFPKADTPPPIEYQISTLSIFLPIFIGIIIPFLVGMIPVRKACNATITKAIAPWRIDSSAILGSKNARKNLWILVEILLLGVSLIFTRFFLSKVIENPIDPSTGQIIILCISFIAIILCISDLIKISFPKIVKLIQNISESYFPKSRMQSAITLLKRIQDAKNILMTLTISLLLLITITTMLNSFYIGGTFSILLTTGGDLNIRHQTISHQATSDIKNISKVNDVCFYTNPLAESQIDGWGNWYDEDGISEQFFLYAVESEAYRSLMNNIGEQLKSFSNTYPWEEVLLKFSDGNYVILQSQAQTELGLKEGDQVLLQHSEGVFEYYDILAFMDFFPGIPSSFLKPSQTIYGVNVLSGIILWEDYVGDILERFGSLDDLEEVNYLITIEDSIYEEQVIRDLKTLYKNYDEILIETDIVSRVDKIDSNLVYMQLIIDISIYILILSSTVALLGLFLVIRLGYRHRMREFGIIRAIGANRKYLIQMIFGEISTVGVIGVISGVFTGIMINLILFTGIPFNPLLGFSLSFSLQSIFLIPTILLLSIFIEALVYGQKYSKIKVVDCLGKTT